MRPLTAATGFKRLGIAVAAAIAAVFGIMAVVSFLIPSDTVREAVKAQIRAVTGLDPVLRGTTSVSLFPSGSVSFTDVGLGEETNGSPTLLAEQLIARLRFFPLLAGRIEIADVSLIRPRVTVTLERDGRSNWSGLVESLQRTLGTPGKRDDSQLSFSEVRVEGGSIVIRDNVRGIVEVLNGVDMSLAWPSISKSFAATGNLIWRGEAIEASISLNDFVAALAGSRSGLKARVTSAPLKVAFDGQVGTGPTLKIEGTLAADTTSLRQALVWLGQRPPPGGGFERFALKAQTNVTGGTIGLSAVNLELDGNTAEGVLTFATDGRQTLQGTLASGELDLTPYVSAFRLLTTNDREWSRAPIALDGLTGFDLDLRLSAAKVALSGTKLGRTAVAANLRSGKLTVTVGESQAFGGVIKGAFALAKGEHGSELKSQMLFSDVDLENCIGEMFGIRRIEGKGNLTFAIEASGPNVLALTRAMNGTASLVSNKGALTGLNVEQLLRRLERRPLSGGSEFRNGRTPFDRLDVAIKIAQGNASVENLRIEGPAVKLAVEGSASIPARDLDLKGVASLISASANDAGFELPFVVQGPWDDPLMLPDTQSLIQRSGAARRLFDAVGERSTARQMRDAIERLTGGRPAMPAAEAAPAAAAAPAR
jgi:AsmA protein